jgi:hypothetical protein
MRSIDSQAIPLSCHTPIRSQFHPRSRRSGPSYVQNGINGLGGLNSVPLANYASRTKQLSKWTAPNGQLMSDPLAAVKNLTIRSAERSNYRRVLTNAKVT